MRGPPDALARRRPLYSCGAILLSLLLCPHWSRAQYTLEDAHDPKRYEPGFTAIPFVFYSEDFNLAGGVAGDASGLIQPQSDTFFLALGTFNSTYGLLGGMDDIQLKPIDRLFLDWQAAYFHFTRDQVYLTGNDAFQHQNAGSNHSSKHNYLYSVVNDVYGSVTLRYLLPIGGGREHVIDHYVLEGGLPVSGGSGGSGFNPLTTGRTFLAATPFFDYQTVRTSEVDRHHYDTNGLTLGVIYDNSDYPLSPASGNITRLSASRDFGLFHSSNPWTTVSAEFTQYLSLGRSSLFRQQVIALNAWTSYAVTTSRAGPAGNETLTDAPPIYETPNLGGATRLRAYPEGRYHDRAAVYATAELRLIPAWNPLGEIGLLKPADIAWWQWVLFAEVGRVGREYNANELLTDLKGDVGFGVRILSEDTVFRIDVAASSEGYSMWANLGQAF